MTVAMKRVTASKNIAATVCNLLSCIGRTIEALAIVTTCKCRGVIHNNRQCIAMMLHFILAQLSFFFCHDVKINKIMTSMSMTVFIVSGSVLEVVSGLSFAVCLLVISSCKVCEQIAYIHDLAGCLRKTTVKNLPVWGDIRTPEWYAEVESLWMFFKCTIRCDLMLWECLKSCNRGSFLTCFLQERLEADLKTDAPFCSLVQNPLKYHSVLCALGFYISPPLFAKP